MWLESEITINGPSGRLDIHFHPMVLLAFPYPNMGNPSSSWSLNFGKEVAPLVIGSKI
jgi:hypothetical protein